MSKKWSRLGLRVNKTKRSKTSLIVTAVTAVLVAIGMIWLLSSGASSDYMDLMRCLFYNAYVVPIVMLLGGLAGGIFGVLAIVKKEPYKWSIPAVILGAIFLAMGVYATIQVYVILS